MVENESNGWAGSGANPWHLDNDTESFLFLTDMGEQPVRIGFQVGAMGRVYYLGKLRLVPHETRMIDMRKLRDAQKADLEKHKIPATATDGSVLWIRLDNVPVMGRLAVIRRSGGVASSYDCTQCQCPAYYTITTIGNSCPIAITGTSQSTAEEWFQPYCNGTDYYQDVTDDSSWSSSNSSIFTINSSALITGVGSGTANAQAGPSPGNECTSWRLVGYSCDCESNGPASGSGPCAVGLPDHVSVVVDQEGYPASCPTTGIYVRQMKMQVVDVAGNAITADAYIQESYSNVTTNTCGNGQPVPALCALTGNPFGVGQFLDSMSVSGNLCGSGISQSSGCGYSLTAAWAQCLPSGTNTLWTSPRVTHSNGVEVNGSWTTYGAGKQFH